MTTQDVSAEVAGLYARMSSEPHNRDRLAEAIRLRLREMRRAGMAFPLHFVVLEAELERTATRH